MHGAVAGALIRRSTLNRHDKLKWVPECDGHVVNNAVVAGNFGGDGETMYVGRAYFSSGDIVPGTIIPSHKCCYVGHQGEVMAANDYEVLINTRPDQCQVIWLHSKQGNTPQAAVKAGKDATTGGSFYVARGKPFPDKEGTHAGKVQHPSTFYDEKLGAGMAYIPYENKEYAMKEYEVLCVAYSVYTDALDEDDK